MLARGQQALVAGCRSAVAAAPVRSHGTRDVSTAAELAARLIRRPQRWLWGTAPSARVLEEQAPIFSASRAVASSSSDSGASTETPLEAFARTMDAPRLIEDLIAAHPVFLLTKAACPFCLRAKDLLSGLKAEYTVIELDSLSKEAKLELQGHLKVVTGAGSVPRVFIQGRSIGGFSETQRVLWKGELVPLLVEAGAADEKAVGGAGHFDAGNPLL
mmetsp:Transcript_67/g.224  ORF Transcript_67/g.224 Transcript_67/m.224 type:complete len:216 (-) Transcript_67:50-697(-)|eukprot:CAMPEP_0183434232 /NCGR_PEP_ID=MMETSP0370-20130417/62004_1 /TAXON_ID=268820 /ORGANISM="Peridinium aciculiferum, Strain PAER-2" /LENGTH=215 /DNA_ID=CAMNT_0025620807 /DNA_START=75 /DNA_END=722 /DNA_ORIENTATION=+